MIANDLRRLALNTPVFVDGASCAESHYLAHEVIEIKCIDGDLYVRTGEYMGENAYSPAVSVGEVLDTLAPLQNTVQKWHFNFPTRANKGEPSNPAIQLCEIVEMTELYRSFAVHKLEVNGDTLVIMVRGTIDV